MTPQNGAVQDGPEFVRLLGEFLATHAAFREVFGRHAAQAIPFASIRDLVSEDEGSPLYRLKQSSHRLFRTRGVDSPLARSELLFDLVVGSLFHETMKLRESLYQEEVYAPRVAELHDAVGDDPGEGLGEFEQILGKHAARLADDVGEVRTLLAQTLELFRRLLIERAGSPMVTRSLTTRRAQVDAVFPEGFEGLFVTMHGSVANGLVVAAHALIDSAYFAEGRIALREVARKASPSRPEVDQLDRYAEGMQAFLIGDYDESLAALEAWADLGGADAEPAFARRAAAALDRLGRLVDANGTGTQLLDTAKRLVLRLETGAVDSA